MARTTKPVEQEFFPAQRFTVRYSDLPQKTLKRILPQVMDAGMLPLVLTRSTLALREIRDIDLEFDEVSPITGTKPSGKALFFCTPAYFEFPFRPADPLKTALILFDAPESGHEMRRVIEAFPGPMIFLVRRYSPGNGRAQVFTPPTTENLEFRQTVEQYRVLTRDTTEFTGLK